MYIRKAVNTQLKGKLPDEYVTEFVEEKYFTEEHKKLGGWEIVSMAEAIRLINNNQSLIRKKNNVEKLREERFKKTIQDHKEFREFKEWKERNREKGHNNDLI